MQEIIQNFAKDRDILAPLLKTNYFSWQSKYLESMIYLGDIHTPKKKPWQIRDLILLVKSQLSKVQLVAALMKHSKEPGTLRYILNEKELFEISGLLNRSDGNFVKDLFAASELHSVEILKKAQQFVYFLEPSKNNSLVTATNDFESTFSQMANIMESVTGSKIDTQPLKTLFNSINEFLKNSKGNIITCNSSDTKLMNNVIQNINQYVGSINKPQGSYVEEVSSEEYGQLALSDRR